jgi:WD40 repeat protein/tRNA A-37 threonylcarbamoyl transferase component Bud32
MPEPTPSERSFTLDHVPSPANGREADTLTPAAAAPSPGTALPPEQMPGYDLLGVLGRGAMGVVYKARHQRLNRIVALKMILAGGHAGEAELARFRTEAETVARLRHPGVVQIYDVGEHAGLPYLALEYCDGGSLADRLGGTPLPPTQAAALVEHLARAIDAAHRQHVIHRDLKPANVLLAGGADSPTGRLTPKVTDFGLAKKLDEGSSQTQTGTILGTPSYMAPEQAGGKPKAVGPAADVYALGAILYECLTGRPPFRAATTMDTLIQVLYDEPVPPTQLQPKTPQDLETICLKCLHKEPAKRYATAADLAEDLRRFQADEPIAARPVGSVERVSKWARRRPAVAALLAVSVVALLALLSGGTAFTLRLQEQIRQTEQARDDLAHQVEATDKARQAAEDKEQEARFNQYVAQMNLVQRDYEANNIARVRELLDVQVPRAPGAIDYRNFEWYYWQRMSHRELLTLRGHTGPVSGVAFSPDGKRLASASRDESGDETVKVCDAQTGQELLSLKGHTDRIFSVAYSPDGRRLASAGGDHSVRVWDAINGQELLSLKKHTGQVYCVVFSPDSRRLASAGADDTVRVWDAIGGHELLSFQGRSFAVQGLAFSPDGARLASAGHGDKVRLWDAGTGQELITLQGHTNVVMGVAFSPDGRRLAAADQDSAVRVWDAISGQQLLSLQGHTGSVYGVAYSPDGRRLASASRDSTVRVWDAISGRELLCLQGHTGLVSGVVFSPDSRRLASAGDEDQTVRVWDAISGQELLALRGHTNQVYGVAFSPDGQRLASAGHDQTVRVWDAASGQALLSLKGHTQWVHGVAYSADGRRLASGSFDQTVRIWDAATGQQLLCLQGHTSAVMGVAFSPDGRRLASAGQDSRVRVWDTVSGQELLSFDGVWCVAFSPDGRRLASANNDETVRVWDAVSDQELLALQGHTSRVYGVAFSPDGRRLASGSFDQTVRIWDAATGQQLLCLQGHTSAVMGVAFSPDGRRLASAGADQTVRVWDAASGQELLSLKGRAFRLGAVAVSQGVAFSPDGQRLASGSWDGTVRVWEASPVPAEIWRRRGLVSDVHSLFDEVLLREEVVAALRKHPTLSESDRAFALQMAQTHTEDCERLNQAAWKVVKARNAGKDAYALALRWAEAAVRLAPGKGDILNTLGVAQYRVGQHEAAFETLARSEKLNTTTEDGSSPSDLAFLAMAQHQLGRKEQAQATLARLREALTKRRWAKNAESTAFLREVETLIDAPPPPKE